MYRNSHKVYRTIWRKNFLRFSAKVGDRKVIQNNEVPGENAAEIKRFSGGN